MSQNTLSGSFKEANKEANGKVDNLLRVIDIINDRLGKAVSFLIIPIFLLVGYQVVIRYIATSQTAYTFETSLYLFGVYAILGGAYAHRHNAHVRMDALFAILSPRTKAILDVITSSIFFFFIITLFWTGWDIAYTSLLANEVSFDTELKLPMYPLKMMIPLAAALVFLQGLAKFIRDIFVITGKRS